ncbi:hypothetical protein PM082_024976 [Marasmius tenuissimus]|nr:hypothetical protein PM082_024976 [Marasmius tenuissimus]
MAGGMIHPGAQKTDWQRHSPELLDGHTGVCTVADDDVPINFTSDAKASLIDEIYRIVRRFNQKSAQDQENFKTQASEKIYQFTGRQERTIELPTNDWIQL